MVSSFCFVTISADSSLTRLLTFASGIKTDRYVCDYRDSRDHVPFSSDKSAEDLNNCYDWSESAEASTELLKKFNTD